MKIDLTYRLCRKQLDAFITMRGTEGVSRFGHFGTHFDIQDKQFPLDYTERAGIVFDVGEAFGRDITVNDIDASLIEPSSFVLIRTSMIERVPYGSDAYFTDHPQLEQRLIERIVAAGPSMIGLDMAGIRRGAQHAVADRFCADHDTFIVENLVNLDAVVAAARSNRSFLVHTYPLNLEGFSGLPSRVVAEF